MSFDPLTALFEAGKMAIERIWPDPIKRAEEVRKLEELKQTGDLARMDAEVKLLLGQLQINMKEAEHKSVFVAGWRPFIGWVGGFSLAYAAIFHPFLMWLWMVLQATEVIPKDLAPPPYVEAGLLGTVVTGMLGIGAMRSYDKGKGTVTQSIRGS